MNIQTACEELILFAQDKGFIGEHDIPYVRNALIDILKIPSTEGAQVPEDFVPGETATSILEVMLDYMAENGLVGDTITERELMDTRIMGVFMARPSDFVREFKAIEKESGIKAATDWFYAMSRASNYIRVDAVSKNILWPHDAGKYGTLEITINLSKPEKDPREIAKLKTIPQAGYPKCLLCLDNMGYAGRLNHPARQTLRTIPLELDDEAWYMQYSPYVYYNEHCIIFKHEHVPMKISRSTFKRLLEFVEKFPHYFLGSNADLPIVGGSILNHDHFQGGAHILPMAKAKVRAEYKHAQHPEVEVSVLDWPMSVVRLKGSCPNELVDMADEMLAGWRGYSDEACDILAFSGDTPHNTITPIARRRDGAYELDLVLRNNRTSDEHKLGIFHPHDEWHHIKKENIGLIEVMGLFILPGRLRGELELIENILTGSTPYDAAALADESNPLSKHAGWIADMVAKNGCSMSSGDAHALLEREVGDICTHVLSDAGVYKDTPEGQAGIERFLSTLGYAGK